MADSQQNDEAGTTNVIVNQQRYGAPGLAPVAPSRTTTVTEDKPVQHINWGGILKGAAIVAGVVLVGIVGAWAVGGLVGMLAHGAVTGSVVNSLAIGGHAAVNGTGTFFGVVFQQLSHMAGIVMHGLGMHTAAMGPAGVAATHTVAGPMEWLTGLFTGGVALHQAMPHLMNIHPTTMGVEHVTTTQTAPETGGAEHELDPGTAALASSKVMKVGYHVAEDHSDYHDERGRAALMAKRAALASQSWAEKVGGPQMGRAVPTQPAAGSFAERMDAQQQAAALATTEAAR